MKDKKNLVLSLKCCLILLITVAIPSYAESVVLSGTFSTWSDNDYFPEGTPITFNIDYDESWIQEVTSDTSDDGQTHRVINIIDYYDQGGRLSISIGDEVFHEISSENAAHSSDVGWANSIPYIIFDQSNNLVGVRSLWLDNIDSNQYSVSIWNGVLTVSIQDGPSLEAPFFSIPDVVPDPRIKSVEISGSFLRWSDNDYFSEDAPISLKVEYDESWIKEVTGGVGGDQVYRIVNIMDYYEQGARLSFSIDGEVFHEISSDNPVPSNDSGWNNSLPYAYFSKSNNLVGIRSMWSGGDANSNGYQLIMNGGVLRINSWDGEKPIELKAPLFTFPDFLAVSDDPGIKVFEASGAFSQWSDNNFFPVDTPISLRIEYDESWLEETTSDSDDDQAYRLNIMNYYDQGARLSFTIGDEVYNEVNSENPFADFDPHDWFTRLPYVYFDQSKNPIGIHTIWRDNIDGQQYQVVIDGEILEISRGWDGNNFTLTANLFSPPTPPRKCASSNHRKGKKAHRGGKPKRNKRFSWTSNWRHK